jgi:hypothetical protein
MMEGKVAEFITKEFITKVFQFQHMKHLQKCFPPTLQAYVQGSQHIRKVPHKTRIDYSGKFASSTGKQSALPILFQHPQNIHAYFYFTHNG